MKFTGERFLPFNNLLEDEIGYEHLHRYYAAANLVKNKHVLDIACGEGYGSEILAAFASEITGVDIDEESIKLAIEKYTIKNKNLHFKCGSATAIPFNNATFDVVISFETIEHLDENSQELFLKEIKRVLIPGGILIMSTPDKKIYSDRYSSENKFHIHEFYKIEFINFIKNHFTNTSFFEQGYEVVSIINNANNTYNQSISIFNINYENSIVERKYLIAIASDDILSNDINSFSSVIPKVDKDFLTLTDRLIVMNKEIEDLGKWGHSLDKNLVEEQSRNNLLNNKIEDIIQKLNNINTNEKKYLTLEESITQLQSNIKNLNNQSDIEKAGTLKVLETQKESIAQLQSNIKNLNEQSDITKAENLEVLEKHKVNLLEETHIFSQKLIEKELLIDNLNKKVHVLHQENNVTKERLKEIYNSDGWGLLSKYYNIKGKLLPENSIRYKQIKNIFNYIGKKNIAKNTSDYSIPSFNDTPIFSPEVYAITLKNLVLPFYDFPTVSIIIPAYNAWEMNHQCIQSIIKNTQGVAYEVLLADDTSTDDTKNCTDFIENLIHIKNKTNLGFLNNCNNASKFAKGKYILFLNNDTQVNSNWLAPLVNLIESDEKIGMVGSKLIYPDGKLQEAGGIIWNDASGWNYGHKQDPTLPEFNYVKEVDYISGASILIKKDLWLKAGGFDERYSPAYFEDTDFAFTIRSMGYKVLYQPLSEVIHFEGYSHGTEIIIEGSQKNIKSYQEINKQKFYEKWQKTLIKEHLPNAQNVFNARDKSINKKTVLIVDHYVPHYDKDAGSKTTFQYIKLFTLLGLNVKFIGDNFFKHEPYTTELQQMGVEVLYGSWYNENWQQWVKENCKHFDYVYLNRPHISIKYIDFIKEYTNAKILYYGHDLHFLREEMQYKVEKDPKLLISAAKWKTIELSLFKKSDVILTPSINETEIISGLDTGFNVETILMNFFSSPAIPVTNFSTRNNIVFVGGFNHTPNVDAIKWFCDNVWPLVIKKLPLVKFIIVGSNPPEFIKELQSSNIEVKGYVSETELKATYDAAKIAVIPLRYGAGVKGKTVEAMYNGLPLVSTSFGLEGMPGKIKDFIPEKEDAAAFADEIIRLYDDINLLTDLSLMQTNYINEFFTQDAAEIKMRKILDLT